VIELVSPLTADGHPDEAALARLIGRVGPWADALVLAGPGVGEGLTLSDTVWAQVVRAGLAAASDEAAVMIGITGVDPEATRRRLEEAEDLLAAAGRPGPAMLVDLPLWYHSNRGLPEQLARWAGLTARPLVLVNHPGTVRLLDRPLKHANIRTEVLKKLSALTGIEGLIFAGEARRESNYRRAVRARPGFAIYDYDERAFLGRPSQAGVVTAGGNLIPEVWRRLVDASLGRAGQVTRFADYQRQLWGLSTVAPGLDLDPAAGAAVEAWLAANRDYLPKGE
jgi:dihydrodipicolinate synthase/N-acetylneuraminate lyase